MKKIYSDEFIEKLFDDMSGSYSRMNHITSFGFSERWRKIFVRELNIESGKVVVDLLTGMGECWKYILENSNDKSELIALDFSSEMIKRAKEQKRKLFHKNITILQENVFQNSIKDESADYLISGFGLKTFNEKQLHLLAKEVERILKIGGKFSFIDVSVPENKLLRFFYLFYLKNIIPTLGKLFLGNPETYRMLGIYTESFKNSKRVEDIFRQYKLKVEYKEYFFGCASGICGKKI